MELLDRYLNSIRSCLPETQRDDIINELSENLHAQIEDREAELDRSLSEPEVEAILKKHGHPLVVASRYRQDQRSVAFGKQWIGPVLFPFYIRVLKFNLGLSSLIILIILAALFASGHSVTVFGSLPTFLYQFLVQFVTITAIFAAADRHWMKFPDRWDPRNLKHPWHPAFALQAGSRVPGRPSSAEASHVSWFDSVAQFVALGISIAWLRVAQNAPFLIFGPAAAFIKPAPIWHQFYWPVVLLALAGMAQAGMNLIRPDWIALRTAYHIFGNLGWLVILFFLLKGGNWVVLADVPGPASEGYRRTVEILNQCLGYTLIACGIVAAYSVSKHARRLVRGVRARTASPAASNL